MTQEVDEALWHIRMFGRFESANQFLIVDRDIEKDLGFAIYEGVSVDFSFGAQKPGLVLPDLWRAPS